jgi:DNA-binding GntR family transcriptional regulator
MIEKMDRWQGEPARQYAQRVLLYNIVNLNLKPGQEISESELSALLGVSRTPIHESLLNLSLRKLVEIYPQKGTFVALIDIEYVEAVRFNRFVLESAIVELACENDINANCINKLEKNITLQQFHLGNSNYTEMLQLDKEFHQTLFELCNKEIAYTLLEDMMPHFDRERKLSFEAFTPAQIVEDHIQIVNAIKNKDKVNARQLMEAHMTRALVDQQYLRRQYPQYFKK